MKTIHYTGHIRLRARRLAFQVVLRQFFDGVLQPKRLTKAFETYAEAVKFGRQYVEGLK